MKQQGFFSLAFSKQVAPKALKVALFVGTMLALINHSEKIIAITFTQQDIFKIFLTYLVPYGVSTWSAVEAIKSSRAKSTSE